MSNKSIIEIDTTGLARPVVAYLMYLADKNNLENYRILTSVPDAAKMLGVPQSTLNLWCRQGKVKAGHPAPGRGWRGDVEDARQYLISKHVLNEREGSV